MFTDSLGQETWKGAQWDGLSLLKDVWDLRWEKLKGCG